VGVSPLTVLEARAAVSTDGGASVIVRPPPRSRAGLMLIAVMWRPAELELDSDLDAEGWTELATVTTDAGAIAVLRRACSEEEPPSYTFAFAGMLDAGPPPMVALLVATGVLPAAAAVASGGSLVEASTEFPAPSANATTYSDAALRVYVAASDAGFVAGDHDVATVAGVDTVEGSLLVALERREAAGPVGIAAATAHEAAAGMAATILVAASPPLGAPRWDAELASIGLPAVGV
jgi:hypothetical protein